MLNRVCTVLFLCVLVSSANAQTSAPSAGQVAVPIRDPNALALATKALQALAGQTVIKDITLEATATSIAGPDEEVGSSTLVALSNQQSPMPGGTGQSRVTLNLTGGQRQEIRQGTKGVLVDVGGSAHDLGSHNCYVDSAWFYPVFTLTALANDPTLAVTLAGQEMREGEPVDHLIISRVVTRRSASIAALIQHLSTMDLYLDAHTLLPSALDFNQHPDVNTGTDIPVEIRFSAYQTFGGAVVPTRIQRYLQNSLVLDLTVTNAAVNSGVPATLFTLPDISAGGIQ